MLRRLPRLLAASTVVLALAACSSPTEPQAACAKSSTTPSACQAKADYTNPNV